jgi:hypothetical protein
MAVLEQLEAYLALGDDAGSQMPEVQAHLEQCSHCAQALQGLREAVSEDPWIELLEHIETTVGRPTHALLGALQWHWGHEGSHDLGAPLPTGQGFVGLGTWLARCTPAEQAATGLAATARPLQLSTWLPGGLAQIAVEVETIRSGAEHRPLWRLTFRLDNHSDVREIHLALGCARGLITGMRALRVGGAVEFRVKPPDTDAYWLHVQCLDSQGQWQEHRLELPLLDRTGGGATP